MAYSVSTLHWLDEHSNSFASWSIASDQQTAEENLRLQKPGEKIQKNHENQRLAQVDLSRRI
jgi:hypothetical protein